jgi:hypothetical protein
MSLAVSLYKMRDIHRNGLVVQWEGKIKFMLSILLSIILGIVCEAPSCLVSSARVQTRSCVNLGEQNRIWVAPESTGNLLSGQWLLSRHNSSLLLFPNYPKNYFSLNISNRICRNTSRMKKSMKSTLENSKAHTLETFNQWSIYMYIV